MPGSRVVDPVLIVSTGRTGTRFLAQYLDTHYPDVEAHHITPWSTLFNVLGNLQLSGLLSERLLLRLWQALKGESFARTDKSFFVDSNNHLFAFAGCAHRLYPGVRIVHVVRDPRTYVRSHLNWARQRLKSYVANYLVPFWQPNGCLLHEIGLKDWLLMSKFERFCWIWDFKNRLLAGLADQPAPYFRVRFEDITHSTEQSRHLEGLARFIGVTPVSTRTDNRPVNQSNARRYPDWEQWPGGQCQALERFCGRQMRTYGYGLEASWLERVRCET